MEKLPLATVIAREKRTQIRDRLKEVHPSIVPIADFQRAASDLGVELSPEDLSYLRQLYSEGKFLRFVPALRHLKVLHTKDSDQYYISRQLEMSPDKQSVRSELRAMDKPLLKMMNDFRQEKVDVRRLEQIHKKLLKAESITGQLTPQVCKSLIGLSLSDSLKESLFAYLERSNNKVSLERLATLINEYKSTRYDQNANGRTRSSFTFDHLREAFSIDIKKRFDSIRKAFIYFDLDNDGKISWNDFLTVTGYISVSTHEQELFHFFMFLDKGRKGFLNFQDFAHIIDKHHTSSTPQKISKYDPSHDNKHLCRKVNSTMRSRDAFSPSPSFQSMSAKNSHFMLNRR